MIPVTPEMINDGDIDEEYNDLIPRANYLLELWKNKSMANNCDPYGRMVYFLLWLKQEIATRRLPIPVDGSYLGTIKYLTGEGGGSDSIDVDRAMGEMIQILQGRGLVKPRHYPLLISMMDDFIAVVEKNRPGLEETDSFYREYVDLRNQMVAGAFRPPFASTAERNRFDFASGHTLAATLPGQTEEDYELGTALTRTMLPLLGDRPLYARKQPMPAPVPGLLKQAPDATAVRDWERQVSQGKA